MEPTGSGSDASRQVQVRFVTRLKPPLRVPPTSMAVPSHLTRLGLSEIVNLLLENSDPEHGNQPFDFLIDGELIRMPLDQFLMTKGISAEKVLEIEYVKAVVPRKQEDPCPHDDWVSAVDGSYSSFILTGCYDGLARIWEGGEVSECTHILEGHNGAITSAKFIEIGGVGTEMNFHVVTSSKDRLLRLWKCGSAQNRENPIRLGAYKIFPGHTSAVQSVAVSSSREMICSGSWDCSIKLWDAKDSEEDGDGNTISLKKRKVNSMTTEFKDAQSEGAATSTLMGHTQCVSAVTWPDPDVLYSASWDHSIRQWDVPSGKETWTMVCGKALNCLDIGGESSSLVAAGGSDPVLRIWDPRKPGSLAPIFQFSSHASWISACKWHPRSWFHLLSASYDGKVMLWDLRTAWPLAIMDSHQDKVLCADWWKGDSVVSGGADSKLRITSGIEIQ
ncbi:transducin/WD40 repeat-like superfamily protein [Carex rostrata]